MRLKETLKIHKNIYIDVYIDFSNFKHFGYFLIAKPFAINPKSNINKINKDDKIDFEFITTELEYIESKVFKIKTFNLEIPDDILNELKLKTIELNKDKFNHDYSKYF